MSIDPKEIDTVMLLTADDRQEFFIDQVSESRTLWALCSPEKGWPTFMDDTQGFRLFPLWSDQVFAEQNAVGEWAGFETKSFDIEVFIQEVAPELEMGGMLVSVFKKTDDLGYVIPADTLAKIFQSFQPRKS